MKIKDSVLPGSSETQSLVERSRNFCDLPDNSMETALSLSLNQTGEIAFRNLIATPDPKNPKRAKYIHRLTGEEARDLLGRGPNKQSTPLASFHIDLDTSRQNDLIKTVTQCGIFVNESWFFDKRCEAVFQNHGISVETAFQKLWRPILEHEITEAWALLSATDDPRKAHNAARCWEYSCAIDDGVADLLLDFHVAINPSIKAECEAAYNFSKDLKLKQAAAA